MLNPNALDAVPLKDAIVLVGAQGQVVKTPLGPASLAQVMAEGIENLLSRQVLVRPSWAQSLEALLLVVTGIVMVGLLQRGLVWGGAATLSGMLLLGSVSWLVFISRRLLLDATTPSLVLALAFAAALGAWLFELRMTYVALRMAFADSLPRASINKLARRPSLLKLEGDTRAATYLVCGVRGLSALAASRRDDPAGFTRLTEKLLTPLIDQAMAHGGTIDRLTADGFAAFWNAPLEDADHALHACEAGSAMTMAWTKVAEELAQQDGSAPAMEIGMGIATGPVIAGGFGASGRMGYSVHGDAVTLTLSLQALSHLYGAGADRIGGNQAAGRARLCVSGNRHRRGRTHAARDALRVDGGSGDQSLTEIPRVDGFPRSHLPGHPQEELAHGAGVDRPMPASVGCQPEAL